VPNHSYENEFNLDVNQISFIRLKMKCGNTDGIDGSYEVVSMEKLFLSWSGDDAKHCDYRVPFCWSGSHSIENIQKPVVKQKKNRVKEQILLICLHVQDKPQV